MTPSNDKNPISIDHFADLLRIGWPLEDIDGMQYLGREV